MVAAWLCGSVFVSISEVTLHVAWLVKERKGRVFI